MSEWLTQIDFAWPWAALLLPLPLLTRFLPLPEKSTDERVRVPFLPSLIDVLQLDTRPKCGSGASAVLFWLIWSLLVCALARPEYLTPPQYVSKPMRDIVLILDVSGSMAKNDVQGGNTRLQAVQQSVRKFVAARQSDRIGMVIFASQAWPFAPISEDKQALQMRINQLAPGMIGQQTAIGDALGVAVKLRSCRLNWRQSLPPTTMSGFIPSPSATSAIPAKTKSICRYCSASRKPPAARAGPPRIPAARWIASGNKSTLSLRRRSKASAGPGIRRSIRGRSPSRCYCYCWPPAAVSSGRKWHERFSLSLSVALNRATAMCAGSLAPGPRRLRLVNAYG